MRVILFMPFVSLFLLLSCNEPQSSTTENIDTIIQKHFNAINDRNIDLLMETVDADSVILILPSGKMSSTSGQYRKVNEAWFEDKDWSVSREVVERSSNEKTTRVLSKITYTDIDENGEAYSFDYFLTLIFSKKQEGWKLVFDQNTTIK